MTETVDRTTNLEGREKLVAAVGATLLHLVVLSSLIIPYVLWNGVGWLWIVVAYGVGMAVAFYWGKAAVMKLVVCYRRRANP